MAPATQEKEADRVAMIKNTLGCASGVISCFKFVFTSICNTMQLLITEGVFCDTRVASCKLEIKIQTKSYALQFI